MCILCQQTSPKRWFGNRTMTSFYDVTNSAHQIQKNTNYPMPLNEPPPHEKFLRTPLIGCKTHRGSALTNYYRRSAMTLIVAFLDESFLFCENE